MFKGIEVKGLIMGGCSRFSAIEGGRIPRTGYHLVDPSP